MAWKDGRCHVKASLSPFSVPSLAPPELAEAPSWSWGQGWAWQSHVACLAKMMGRSSGMA